MKDFKSRASKISRCIQYRCDNYPMEKREEERVTEEITTALQEAREDGRKELEQKIENLKWFAEKQHDICCQAEQKLTETEKNLSTSHHIACNFHHRVVGECNCVAIMKSEKDRLANSWEKISQERMERIVDKASDGHFAYRKVATALVKFLEEK